MYIHSLNADECSGLLWSRADGAVVLAQRFNTRSVPVTQRAAEEGRGHAETPASTGAEEEGVSEGGRGQSVQAEGAAAGLGEDRQRQQDAAQEVTGTSMCEL